MWSLTTTASELSDSESLTASCPTPPSLAISEHSLVQDLRSFIEELQTSSQAVSHVNHFLTQESDLVQTTPAICGPQLSSAFASYDPATRCWRMSQGWLLADISGPSWETWPKAGLIVGGEFYPQPNWERRINEIGSGLLPTPAAQEPGWTVGGQVEIVDKDGNAPTHYNQRWYDKNTGRLVQKGITQVAQMWPTPNASDVTGGPGNSGRDGGLNLRTAVKQWPTPRSSEAEHPSRKSNNHNGQKGLAEAVNMLPTPTSRDWRSGTGAQPREGHAPPLTDVVGGQLNPDWVEWLMGWPIGWTSLEPLPADNFAQWLDATINGAWWPNEPDIPRVAKGITNRVDRLKALGNGQVSAVVAAAWNLLTK